MLNADMIKDLIKARGEFAPLVKDTANPFYKSKYAPLDAVIASVTPALLNNGLFLSQPLEVSSDGKFQYLVTRLDHVSGGSMESRILLDPETWTEQVKLPPTTEVKKETVTAPPTGDSKMAARTETVTETKTETVTPKPNAQKFAGTLTYLRRTQICALLGIAPQDEDDDGNSLVPTPAKASTNGVKQTPPSTVAARGNGKPPTVPAPGYDWDNVPQ